MKKVVSTRMDPEELAKARDGLLDKGLNPKDLDTVSQILRLTFYYGLLELCDDPKAPATPESTVFIHQLIGQKKSSGPVTLTDIINQN